MWSCGYDDHSLPPVRGGGNQAFHTAGNWAVMSLLVALLAREETGRGPAHRRQHARREQRDDGDGQLRLAGLPDGRCSARPDATPRRCSRRRCRSAAATAATPRPACRRAPRRSSPACSTCSTASACATSSRPSVILQLGAERERLEPRRHRDRSARRRDLHRRRATSCGSSPSASTPYDFFVETQRIGLATGVIYTPGEALADPHFVARGFPVEIEHPELQRSITYPGAPYRFTATPWAARRAPLLEPSPDADSPELNSRPARGHGSDPLTNAATARRWRRGPRGAGRGRRRGARGARPVRRRRARWRRAGPACRTGRRRPGRAAPAQ